MVAHCKDTLRNAKPEVDCNARPQTNSCTSNKRSVRARRHREMNCQLPAWKNSAENRQQGCYGLFLVVEVWQWRKFLAPARVRAFVSVIAASPASRCRNQHVRFRSHYDVHGRRRRRPQSRSRCVALARVHSSVQVASRPPSIQPNVVRLCGRAVCSTSTLHVAWQASDQRQAQRMSSLPSHR